MKMIMNIYPENDKMYENMIALFKYLKDSFREK